jgi:hypothetical protein
MIRYLHTVCYDMPFDGGWLPVGEPVADEAAAEARAAELRNDPTVRNVKPLAWPIFD